MRSQRARYLVVLIISLQHVTSADAQSSLGFSDQAPMDGRFVKLESRWMIPYRERIPGTEIEFEMIPIPGGSFLMGSPDDEPGRRGDEGPQVRIDVAPMWVGKFEVTQQEYAEYQRLYTVFKEVERDDYESLDRDRADVVTAPTEVYEPAFVHEFGADPLYPATTMTQYAAQQYTKWLSAVTSRQYRLPTEAEWEYACRGHSKTRFSWGNADTDANEHAHYLANCKDNKFARGGQKKANAFGLHDMVGNAAEWTVSPYTIDGYKALQTILPLSATEAVQWPTHSTSGVVRGGSIDSELDDLRSAARLEAKDDDWKSGDADFPRSPWWYTDFPSNTVGFRVFRSLNPLPRDSISRFWNGTAIEVKVDVLTRLKNGRGAVGIVEGNQRHQRKEE